jgi:hypothetical protein
MLLLPKQLTRQSATHNIITSSSNNIAQSVESRLVLVINPNLPLVQDASL